MWVYVYLRINIYVYFPSYFFTSIHSKHLYLSPLYISIHPFLHIVINESCCNVIAYCLYWVAYNKMCIMCWSILSQFLPLLHLFTILWWEKLKVLRMYVGRWAVWNMWCSVLIGWWGDRNRVISVPLKLMCPKLINTTVSGVHMG